MRSVHPSVCKIWEKRLRNTVVADPEHEGTLEHLNIVLHTTFGNTGFPQRFPLRDMFFLKEELVRIMHRRMEGHDV